MTWSNGRQLDSTNVGGMNLSYSYNADGQRTSKSRSAYYTDEYVYYGTQLSTLIRNGVGYKHSLTFIYDDNGQALGFYYDTNLNDSNPGTKYYYVCNAQGDVLQLRDHTNAPVANYYYDAWGKLLGITDANGNAITASNHVAVLNPIRYRGYFYDTETGFYYLNSRYYDPEIGRFINADGYVSTGQGFLGFNMFAYCNNNPVNYSDDNGNAPLKVARFLFTYFIFGGGKNLILNNFSFVSRALKRSKTMKNKINEEIEKYKKGEEYGKGDVIFQKKEPDLWLGVRKADYELTIKEETKETGLFKKKEKTRYVVNVKVYDTYDFNVGDETGDGLGSYLNNFGYWMQENNLGKVYYWEAHYEYKTKWE